MIELASSKIKRAINLKPMKNGLLSFKHFNVTINNPQQMQEKVFLMTNAYLQFDIIIEGDVSTMSTRRDQDFNDL